MTATIYIYIFTFIKYNQLALRIIALHKSQKITDFILFTRVRSHCRRLLTTQNFVKLILGLFPDLNSTCAFFLFTCAFFLCTLASSGCDIDVEIPSRCVSLFRSCTREHLGVATFYRRSAVLIRSITIIRRRRHACSRSRQLGLSRNVEACLSIVWPKGQSDRPLARDVGVDRNRGRFHNCFCSFC